MNYNTSIESMLIPWNGYVFFTEYSNKHDSQNHIWFWVVNFDQPNKMREK